MHRPQPVGGEAVVGGEVLELVPVVIDRIDHAVVGPQQVAAQLQIIGRVGKDHIDARIGQRTHRFDTVHFQNLVQRQISLRLYGLHRRWPNFFNDTHMQYSRALFSPQ